MLMTFADVVGRTLFNRSLTGTVETITLLMGVLVFFGLAWTEVKRKHVVVDTFLQMTSGRTRAVLGLFNALVAFGIASVLYWRLLIMTLDVIRDQELTQIWRLPFWPTAVLESVGMTILVLALAWRVIEAFQHVIHPGE